MKKNCIFCTIAKTKKARQIISSNRLAIAIRDNYPVTKYHTLIIPIRHVSTFFDLKKNEIDSCIKIIFLQKKELTKLDKKIKGFNVGFNSGKVAGQTINHFHIHLIPRRKGDQKDPAGGVRGVIPSKQKY
jgi:diadenosine tetraphosphate (Ap4A) HIT family hydrolase|tara:strand:- start:2008 stop:2397 length:390 start_codon:yes stop_codon:yes gene_type:complete